MDVCLGERAKNFLEPGRYQRVAGSKLVLISFENFTQRNQYPIAVGRAYTGIPGIGAPLSPKYLDKALGVTEISSIEFVKKLYHNVSEGICLQGMKSPRLIVHCSIMW